MRILVLVGAMLLAATAHAEAFSYKGVKLGDSIEVFRAALPVYSCDGSRCSYDARTCETSPSANNQSDAASRFKACLDGASFGGAPVTSGSAFFIEGKLASIRLSIESDFLDIAAGPALETRFGKPQSIDDRPVTNRAGAKFKNWIKTWVHEDQTMRATLRSGMVDTGSVTISNAAFDALQKDAFRKANQAGAKDF